MSTMWHTRNLMARNNSTATWCPVIGHGDNLCVSYSWYFLWLTNPSTRTPLLRIHWRMAPCSSQSSWDLIKRPSLLRMARMTFIPCIFQLGMSKTIFDVHTRMHWFWSDFSQYWRVTLGVRGQLPSGYMVSSLWFLKQFTHILPTRPMANTFKKNSPICPHFTQQVKCEQIVKELSDSLPFYSAGTFGALFKSTHQFAGILPSRSMANTFKKNSPIHPHFTLGAEGVLPSRQIESFLRVFKQFAHTLPSRQVVG